MLSTQTAGAQVEPLLFAADNNRSRMDIRLPAPVGMALRMANIMPELGRFSADITFHG